MLTIGVIATSRKPHEGRVAIHPAHLGLIPAEIREHLIFQRGYGRRFGVADERIAAGGGGMAGRDEIFDRADIILLPKPMLEDLQRMREGGVLWGWAHCVQNPFLTQTAIDRRLTLIAWESMNEWGPGGERQRHVFEKNNEIAGYAAVLHALGLVGVDGHYGPSRKALVIHFGCVSRGAVRALQAHGFNDITVFTLTPPDVLPDRVTGVECRRLRRGQDNRVMVIEPDGAAHSFIHDLAAADIIVNGMWQDTDRPLMFLREDEVRRLKPGSLIIDVSCDAGMGFPFSAPTTFDQPVRGVGQVSYYAVDHTPSYLWHSASWEISKALLPYLPVVMAGPEEWEKNQTIRRAIEIRDGVIQNPKILSFQRRSAG
ncbi:MAG: hypothetical protein AMJ81_04080 [Phycisphaerae bacterium SM23_33]|nr:MAG: hypothetical protein AMJ81_04080 [Phycisphaerae bacterium SM23_33]